MHNDKTINGTKGADMMKLKGAQYDGLKVSTLDGPDIIQLEDVFGTIVFGGDGPDILQSVYGGDNSLYGGDGSDLYFAKGETGLYVSDREGPSGVHFVNTSGARVNLGNGDDTITDKEGRDNTYNLAGGNNTATLVNSAGGNTVKFGGDGVNKVTFDWSNGGMQLDGPMFINPTTADTVVMDDGSEMVIIRTPYAFQNASGKVEIGLEDFNASEDSLRFDGDSPDFVVVEGGKVMATFLGQNGIDIFQVVVDGAGWTVPDGVKVGSNFNGVGSIYGQPEWDTMSTRYDCGGGGDCFS